MGVGAILALMSLGTGCAAGGGGRAEVQEPVHVDASTGQPRSRARALGVVIGALPTGPRNLITDVAGVTVGHATLVEGDSVRTGVTVVRPHDGNLYRSKVPAAIRVGNGYGKLAGSTQVVELGELESPIALTNTLNVGLVLDAMVGWMLEQPGNENVRSVNCVVGETNDGYLNDIRGRHVRAEHVRSALASASADFAQGSVGAGTGTRCFGWKGGIGSSSRVVDGFTVGVLVQSNFGGDLRVAGRPYPPAPTPSPTEKRAPEDGSCMIIVATDAPLRARNLRRLCDRALAGMARTGASFSNGSGDYVIAFSTAESLRIEDGQPGPGREVANGAMTPLFRAVADATEEAILDSMFMATAVTGRGGHSVPGLPTTR